MLLVAGLVVLALAGAPQEAEHKPACIDHSAEPIRSKAEEPACWEGSAELENEDRVEGDPVKVPPRFAKAPIKNTVVMLKLCIDEQGRVQRVLLLKASGNSDLDEYLCKEYGKWRFRPARAGEQNTTSVLRVVVTLRPV
jgi:TonB family protein